MHDTTKLLAGVDLFAGIPERHLKKLAGMTREAQHPAGKEIAHEGQGGMAFHLVVAGKAEVSSRGRDLRQLGPGDYFGEIAMIDGGPRSATVVTVEPTTTLAIEHVVFEGLLDKEPEFARALLRALCARVRELEGA